MQLPQSGPRVSVSVALSVFGILVAATVALIVGYLQRKQMRQIEAYRQNPALGLIPAPHPVTAFVRRHKYLVLISGGGVVLVVLGFLAPGPMTRLGVLSIAFGASGIISGLLFDLIASLVGLFGRAFIVAERGDKKPT